MARFRPRRRSSAPVSTRRHSRLRRFRNMFPRFSPLARLRGLDVLNLFKKSGQKRLSTAYVPSLFKRHSLVEGLEPRVVLSATVGFNVATASAPEGDVGITPLVAQLLVDGDLTGASNADREVQIMLSSSSASSGVDFVVGGAFSIPAGDYTGGVLVPIPTSAFHIVGDTIVEPNETVTVNLLAPGAQVTASGITQHTHTILNDDFVVMIDAAHFNGNGNDLTVRIVGTDLEVVSSTNTVIETHHAPTVTGIVANGGAGNDTLRIDSSILSNAKPVEFNGNAGTDTLVFTVPGATNTVNYNFAGSTNSPTPFAGTISVDGTVITFTGLEPITQLGTAVDMIFQLSNMDDHALLRDVDGLGTMELSNTSATFETVTFPAPRTIDIRGRDGNDTIEIDSTVFAGVGGNRSFDPLAAGPTRKILISGGDGNDTIVVDNAGIGTRGIDLELNGNGGNDLLIVPPTTSPNSLSGPADHHILWINGPVGVPSHGSIVTLRNLTIDDTADSFDDPLIRIHDARSTLRLDGVHLKADDDLQISPAPQIAPVMILVQDPQPDVDVDWGLNNGGSASTLEFTNVPVGQDTVIFIDNQTSGSLATDLESANLIVNANEDTPLKIRVQSDSRTITSFSASNGGVTHTAGVLTYTGFPHFSGTDTINFTLSGAGQSGTANGSILVNIAAVNDPPVISLPNTFTTNEEQALIISSNLVGVTDVDAGAGIIVVTLSVPVNTGTIAVNNAVAPAVTVAGNNTNSVTLTGTLSDINLILQDNVGANLSEMGVVFTPAGPNISPPVFDFGFNGTVAFTIEANDQGNTGAGGPQTGSKTATITVNAVNDAPVHRMGATLAGSVEITGTNPPPTFATVAEDSTNNLLSGFGGNLLFVTDDASENNGVITTTLTVTNGTLNVGDPSTSTADTSHSGTTVSGDLTNTITLTGTVAQINNTLATLRYTPSANFNGNATLTINTNDNGHHGSGGAKTDNDPVRIVVTGVNDPPVNLWNGVSFQSLADPTPNIDVLEDVLTSIPNITVSDPDAGNNALLVTLTATNGTVHVNASVSGGVPSGNVTGNGTSSVTLTGTLSQLNATLATLGFKGNLNYNGPATLTINTNDQGHSGAGGPLSDTDLVEINVLAVNDPPVITVGGSINPAAQSVLEDNVLLFDDSPTNNANRIQITDVDGNFLTVTLTVTNGTLTLGSTANLSGLSGNGTSQVIFSGTLVDVNNALSGGPAGDGLKFTPNLNYFGPAKLTIVANDNGNTGIGGPQETMLEVDIAVNPVNDPPRNTFGGTFFEDLPGLMPPVSNPPTVTTPQNVPITFAGSTRLGTTDVDADAGAGNMKVTVSVPGGTGTLSFGSTAGLVMGFTNNASTIVAEGKLSAIQSALNNLVYTPAANFSGSTVLTLTVDDQGNFGLVTGAGTTDTDTVNITVAHVNQPPSFNIGGTIVLVEDNGSLTVDQNFTLSSLGLGTNFITNISPGPGEAGPPHNQNVIFTVTTSDPNGIFSIPPEIVAGSFSLPGDTTADLDFEIGANKFGTAVVTIVATDTASPALSSAPQSFLVIVQPVNDNPQIVLPPDLVGAGAAGRINEDTPVTFRAAHDPANAADRPAIVIDDDSGDAATPQAIQARFRVQFGTLALVNPSPAGVTVSGQGTATLTLTGTEPAIQAALNNGLTYTPNANHNRTRDTGAGAITVSNADPDLAATTVGPFAAYNPSTQTPTAAGDRLIVEVNDFGHEGGPDKNTVDPMGMQWDSRRVLQIEIAPVNDAPTLHTPFPSVSVPQNAPTHVIPLGTNLILGSNFFDDVDKLDNFPDNLTITATSSNPSLVTVGPTLPDGQTIAGSDLNLTFQTNQFGQATITVTATDNAGESVTTTFLVTVGQVRTPPVISGPTSVTLPEDGMHTFSGTVSVFDPDPQDANLTMTLSVGQGVLSLSQTAGLTFSVGDGTNDATMTFTGSQASINAALNGLKYTPTADFFGTDSLLITAVDNLTPIPQVGTKTITLNVTSVNDPPIAVNDQYSVMEDSTNNTLMVLENDLPGPPNESGQNLKIVGLKDEFSNIVSFTATTLMGGTVTIGPTPLDGLWVVYTPRPDFWGTDSFQYIIRDDGSPNLDSTFGTVTIEVTPKNDQVVLNAVGSRTIDEDNRLALGTMNMTGDGQVVNTVGIQVLDDHPIGPTNNLADPHGPSASSPSVVELRLTAVHGTFSISPQGSVTVASISGGVLLTGKVVDINETLNKSKYIPNPDYNNNIGGPDTITSMVDDLGNIGDGGSTTAMKTTTVNITAVNDAPFVTFNPDPVQELQQTSLTNRTYNNFIASRHPGPPTATDEAGQTVTVALAGHAPHPDNPFGSVVQNVAINNANGQLTFQILPNTVGTEIVTVTVTDNGPSAPPNVNTATQTFLIHVGINKEPIFTLAGNHPAPMNPQGDIQVLQGSGLNIITGWLATLFPGPFDDIPFNQQIQSIAISDPLAGSTLSIADFDIYPTISNLVLPSPGANPAPNPDGTSGSGDLRFMAKNAASGVLNLRITVVDNGGTANGGDNTATRDFKIEIEGVNTPPTFQIMASHTSNEDAGLQNVPGFAFNISPGPPAEAGQTVTFQVTNNGNPGLFSTQPSITSGGTLVYQAAPNANGVAVITVVAKDNGGGNDTSAPQSFVINVNPVNDAPTVTFSQNPIVLNQSASPQLVFEQDHLTMGPGGGPDEAGQTTTLVNVSATNPGLFSVQPTYQTTGNPATRTLVFLPAANAFGTSTVTVTVQDNGGTANGGVDTTVATFQIVINPTVSTAVVGRHIWYKDSAFDLSPGALNVADDAAIDSSKTALLPGQTGTFANTTGFNRGINGIMIDVQNLATTNPATLLGQLSFRTGNNSDTSTAGGHWTPLNPAHVQDIAVRQIAADTHRITIAFADNAIRNTWLEVRLAAGAVTGLAATEVHYWGNAAGNTGANFPGFVDVAALDLVSVGSNVGPLTVLVDNPNDLNKDRFINAFDIAVIAANISPSVITHITPSGAAGVAGGDVAFSLTVEGDSGTSSDADPLASPISGGGSTGSEDGRVGDQEDDDRDGAFASLDQSGGSMDEDLLDLLAGDLAGSSLLM